MYVINKIWKPRALPKWIGTTMLVLVAASGLAAARAVRQQGTTDQAPAPVRSPADEMKTFVIAPGYHAELVASEPLIQDPVLIDWDPDGRMWAIEMPGYMHDILASDEHDPTGRIVVLEDTNNDGLMDKRTVFAEGLILPRALKVLDHGVLVGEPPNLWLMHDTNRDLKADTKELVSTDYGRLEASVEHNANGLTWGMDNWMHTSEVDVFLRLRAGTFEVRKTLSRGQWGNSQDDAGRIYRNSNMSVLHVDLVPTPYFARNPNLLRTRGSYEPLQGRNGEVNDVYPAAATPGVNRGYQTGVLRANGTLASYTAVCSPTVFRGDRLPADAYGNVFVAEPAGNTVSRVLIADDGNSLTASRAYPTSEFLRSTDERFRPVYLSSAPDGTLYMVDIYRGIIQYRGYITEYLRDQILARKLEQPTGLGRIYRIVHDSTQRGPRPTLGAATPAQLVQTLSHPNGWWRDTAQRLLVERGDRSVVPALTRIITTGSDARARVHALWTLEGLEALTPDVVVRALGDSSRDVRASAIRVAEGLVGTKTVETALLARLEDGDWFVREQLGASLGALPSGPRETAIAAFLSRYATDQVAADAALSGIRGGEADVLEILLRQTAGTSQRTEAITLLAATAMRSGQDAVMRRVLDLVAEASRPEWQRTALLAGAEAAVLNAPLPGGRGGRGGGAIDGGRGVVAAGGDDNVPGGRGGPPGGDRGGAAANAPGSRGGPGGAAAFPTAAGPGVAAGAGAGAGRGGRGGANGPVTRISREPASLIAMRGTEGEFARRVTALLARVEWPGKPGVTAIMPLTPEQQRLYDAGEQVYQNLCQACHQVDGRGQERLAASLVGSALALGDSAIAVRVVLNGKEGTVGLMPPMAALLNDDQIAGALTYVRRQWGQSAPPVEAATVAATRAAVSGRMRPWTDAELASLAAATR